jgi:zinc metalloprotease ZmpB
MTPIVQTDADGVPRFLRFDAPEAPAGLITQAPQAAAHAFLQQRGDLLALAPALLKTLDQPPSAQLLDEQASLRVLGEKRQMDSITVAYAQTHFGLPVIGAGLSVTLREAPLGVLAATSTVRHDITVERPGAEPIQRARVLAEREIGAQLAGTEVGLDLTDEALNAHATTGATTGPMTNVPTNAPPDMRINAARLVVFRYLAAQRQGDSHPTTPGTHQGFAEAPLPSLPLPPLPPEVAEGSHRVAVELYFALTTPAWGRLNWVMYIDVITRGVLQLKPLVDHAVADVFLRDPITKGSGLTPAATSAQLNPLRDPVTLAGLVAPVAGTQALAGDLVRVVDAVAPAVPVPTAGAPYNFIYDSRTDNFAAANAYFQCDRFFRLVRDLGFALPAYFDGTSFPVQVDHRGFGGLAINARCPGDATGDGIGTLEFALADLSDTSHPLGIAADWRVVLHELGGHGILWDHVRSPNFGFAHSAGDSFAAILNDPATGAPDRFLTFPWVNIGRRHDRTPAAGWGWGGANDVGGYSSEQVLSTTLFRLYRSLGGDSTALARREFAAASTIYLILRAVGQLTPATNPGNALAFEQQLEVADSFVWSRTAPAETHAGGAYAKVIRWAFEQQGLFKAPGAPSTALGAPPAVDVYIDDGRHGAYPFQPVHWGCTDIWNRRSPGAAGGVHQEPVVGATNYAYVRIKNRGTQAATSVQVRGFHALPGIGLVYPDDWAPMTTPVLAAPNLAAHDSTGVVVGPFEWTPSQVGHECMFFSVSANGDPSNIDGRITGSIPEWRLVPFDNNIGQRNVHPVALSLTRFDLARRRFWLRNPFDRAIKVELAAALPAVLAERGWTLGFVSPGAARFGLAPGQVKEIVFAMTPGKPLTRTDLPADSAGRTLVLSAQADGIPLGGMSYEIDPDYVDPNLPGAEPCKPCGPCEPCGPGQPLDLAALLKCLKEAGAHVDGVRLRTLNVDIVFKGDGCC